MAEKEHEKCTMHAAHESRIDALEKHQDETDVTIRQIFSELKNISEKLMGRPGWAVCMIITLLTTALGIAVTIALK